MAVTLILDPSHPKYNAKQAEYVNYVLKIFADFQKLHRLKLEWEATEEGTPEFEAAKLQYEELRAICDKHPSEISYGGAIRGGKTFGGIGIFIFACKMFPGSRWAIIRKSMPAVQNAINSMKKIIGNSANVYWKLGAKESFIQFDNGSRIYFAAENYAQDKQHTKFLGMEMNGFLFEQLEEITYNGYNIIKSRAGSWYNVRGAMPPALILSNFNPTFTWVKKEIYDKWIKNTLPDYMTFFKALPKDNPHVTPEQWRMWSTLDSVTKARMIDGEWDIKVEKAFLYSFDEKKHISSAIKRKEFHPIWISVDFNVDPMTAVIFQTDKESYFHVIGIIKAPNSDIYDLCRRLEGFIGKHRHLVNVTGDASGKNRMSGTDGALNQYQIMATQLKLNADQFHVPNFNPPIADRRVFSNSVIENFPNLFIHESCEDLINDVKFTLCGHDKDGNLAIQKTGINEYTGQDNRMMGHLMDCLTYGFMVTLTDFIHIPKS